MIQFLLRLLIGLIAVGTLLVSCKSNTEKEIKTTEITFKKEGELQIFQADSLKATFDIEIADNEFERATGLMYRTSMQDNQGMLFVFDQEDYRYFYMKNTLISLDLIYLDKDLKVVSLIKNAATMNENSLPSELPAQYVLELKAGMADQWKIDLGDQIKYTQL